MAIGHLKLIVMNILSKNNMSGYSLIKQIREETGCWKPSTGSIYPLLDKMLEDGLVNVKEEGRKKIYALTEKGKENLRELIKKKDELFDHLIEDWRVYESIAPKKDDISFMLELLKKAKQGEMPFKELNPELIELKAILFNLLKKDKISKNQRHIKNILNNTLHKLKQIK